MPSKKVKRVGPKRTTKAFSRALRPPSRADYTAVENPMPMAKNIVLKYVDQYGMDAAAGTLSTQIMAATGLYDPDITGTGHQPLGFDQWLGLFYNHYTVEEAFLKATFFTQDASITGLACCLVGLTDDNAVPTTLNAALEQPTYTMHPLGSLGSSNAVVIEKYVDVAKFFGLSRSALLADPTHRGTNAANPTDNVFFHIAVGGTNTTVNPNFVWVTVELVFYAHLTERRELGQS